MEAPTVAMHQHSGHPPSAADAGRQNGEPQRPGFWLSKAGAVAVAFLLIAAFFLLSEHRAHALGAVPWLLLLACPLLHLFLHRGHGGHGRSGGAKPPAEGD